MVLMSVHIINMLCIKNVLKNNFNVKYAKILENFKREHIIVFNANIASMKGVLMLKYIKGDL